MKTLWFATLLLAGNLAHASETAITLNFRNVLLTSQENSAAMVDLTAEIKKQSPATKLAGQRIKSVEVDGEASFLGATVILLASGQALDSLSEEAGSKEPMILRSSFPKTPGTWALGIRGQFSLERVVVTIDRDDTSVTAPSLDPMVRNDVNTQSGPDSQSTNNNGPAIVVVPTAPGASGTDQTVDAAFEPGETLIAVSSSSGLIDYVTFVSEEGPNSFTINYKGSEISDWGRGQLAKTSGCSGDLCVGAVMNRLGDTMTIVGIMKGDKFVMQKSNRKFLVVNRSNLAERPTLPAKPAVTRPAPAKPAGPTRVGRYQVGQRAYYVQDAQHVYTTSIAAIRPNGSVDLRMPNGSLRNITRGDQIAVIYGCNTDGFCVGDQVQTVSANGQTYSARIVGVQSNEYAVLTFNGRGGFVGYWPFQALEK